MVMAQTNSERDGSDEEPRPAIRDVGFFNWLNLTLRRYIGPPPVGPFDKPMTIDTEGARCPICGELMTEHDIDRSGPRTQLHCPKPAA